ncbi:MAG: ATP-binding protein, partial [Oscillochloris sp.]|nr:ATP-binding protein [Oscillochloris sp.]
EGRLTIQSAPCDLVVLLQRVVDEVQSTTSLHRFTLNLPSIPLLISADLLRLEQVFHNLLGNAVKYSPHGGMISVWAELADTIVSVYVRDQGIGIPSSALPHLFTRFYRAPNARMQASSSMGVGLFVVRELVQAHGGSIMVESAEGEGSTFTVRLPISQAHEHTSWNAASEEANNGER